MIMTLMELRVHTTTIMNLFNINIINIIIIIICTPPITSRLKGPCILIITRIL